MFRRSRRITAGRRNFDNSYNILLNNKDKSLELNYKESTLTFYEYPPLNEITIEEFESWSIDRLKLLVEIELCLSKNQNIKEIEMNIKPLLVKLFPLSKVNANPNKNKIILERRKDLYSHFILRIAFCRSKELRERFIRSETTLFKIRYNLLTQIEKEEFVKKLKLNWEFISKEEKMRLRELLVNASYHDNSNNNNNNNNNNGVGNDNKTLVESYFMKEVFIKLPFEEVIDLIPTRSILIKDGFGYVPQILQLSLLTSEFSRKLEESLLRTLHVLPRLDEDDRLLPILNHLSSGYSSNEYQPSFGEGGNNGNENGDINSDNVLSKDILKHFPPEMKYLINTLVKNSHLRYIGRQQLCLFLKGIGLSCEENLKFFMKQFTKNNKMSVEKFNKEYRYNIRHMYGLEGSRINYKPWDYRTILSKPRPAKGEYHGCLLRDLSNELIVEFLKREYEIVDQHDLTAILDHCQRSEYMLGITKIFEITHKQQLVSMKGKFEESIISHPNLYFDRSRQLEKMLGKE
ncbi:DNA primase subunit PRI2 ASCRUDRAFT_38337 [Ascoidea rubescens DSM 1968]|uniref:DNA primase large subunit n=1 Tax=Ascoidea rubescens DSM 1968 TaxID=1344418 RepID=A0A1D2VB90_9ASCO|nr:hypothetical protein ASCRUDRAFT_38337 [Ascoidea rubescens DSM 1968]ODV58964.1 hypothetical protein ASCRUDRAFT_38337 [Ascoidea rubescens DSM 1968]